MPLTAIPRQAPSMLSPRSRCHTDRRCGPISGFGQSTAMSSACPALPATPSGFSNLLEMDWLEAAILAALNFAAPQEHTRTV